MPPSGEILISNRNSSYTVRVSGRANFEVAPPLRELAKSLERETFDSVKLDLSKCTWMDSTFMGVLAMLALRARKISASIEIYGAGEQNEALLKGLGLKKLFTFVATPLECAEDGSEVKSGAVCGKAPDARTVLEAHETLMGVDEGNVKKFEKVVDMVRKDVEANGENNG